MSTNISGDVSRLRDVEERAADPELSGMLLLIGLVCLGLLLVVLAT